MQFSLPCTAFYLWVKSGKGNSFINLKSGTSKMELRIMKLTTVLLLGAWLQVTAAGFGQGITLSVKNMSLKKVFKEVLKQTGYKFKYAYQLLDGAPKVTITVKNVSVERLLDLILDQQFDYEINGSTIVIKPKIHLGTPDFRKGKPILVNENKKVDSDVNVTFKCTGNGVMLLMKREYVLVRFCERYILLISNVLYAEQGELEGNRRGTYIRSLLIVRGMDEMQVFAYKDTSSTFLILKRIVPEVKIVLLASSIKASRIIWARNSPNIK